MKKIIITLFVLLVLSGCTTSTNLGRCIGINGTPKPDLVYQVNYWNLFVAFIFSETIIVPVVVVLDVLKCPVEKVK